MTRKTKALAIGMTALTAGVITLLVLSIPEWAPFHHQDFGMMTLCEVLPHGDPELVQIGAEEFLSPDCITEPVEVHLGTPPFKVHGYTNDEYMTEGAETVTQMAMEWLNSPAGAGTKMTVWEPDPFKADILMALGVAEMVGAGKGHVPGNTTFRRINDKLQAVVRVKGGMPDVVLLTVRHELMHSLGLGHDDSKASPMYPSLAPFLTSPRIYRMTDADRQLLRSRYGG